MTDPGVVPPNWGFYMGDETKRRRPMVLTCKNIHSSCARSPDVVSISGAQQVLQNVQCTLLRAHSL